MSKSNRRRTSTKRGGVKGGNARGCGPRSPRAVTVFVVRLSRSGKVAQELLGERFWG